MYSHWDYEWIKPGRELLLYDGSHTLDFWTVTILSMIFLKKIWCQIGVVIPHVTKEWLRQDKPPQNTHTAGTSTAPQTFEETEESMLKCRSRQWSLDPGPLWSLSWWQIYYLQQRQDNERGLFLQSTAVHFITWPGSGEDKVNWRFVGGVHTCAVL